MTFGAAIVRLMLRLCRCECGNCGGKLRVDRQFINCPTCDRERERLEIRNNELEFESQWANGEVI